MQTFGLQVCRWQTSSAQSCGLRRGASQPSSGGAVVKPGAGAAWGFLLSFSFPFRAFRSAPGGKVRSLGAPREPSRVGRLGRSRRSGRSRWRRKNREPVAVVGAGRRAGGRVSGRRASPRRQRQFRSPGAKKQATKRRTKRDFPSPKRRRFVKTGFFARYKEARRSPRRRGRPGGQKPGPGKDDRRRRLLRFAVKKSELAGRLLHFAGGKSCGVVGFRTSPEQSPAALSAFALRRDKVLRRSRLSYFAVKKSGGRVGFAAPRGNRFSGSVFSGTAAPFRANFRQIQGRGYRVPKNQIQPSAGAAVLL